MNREKTLSSKVIFDGRALKLRVDTVQKPDGRKTTREIVEHDQVIVVVAIDDKDNVLLVRQYRTPVQKELLEIPAGGIEKVKNRTKQYVARCRKRPDFCRGKR